VSKTVTSIGEPCYLWPYMLDTLCRIW